MAAVSYSAQHAPLLNDSIPYQALCDEACQEALGDSVSVNVAVILGNNFSLKKRRIARKEIAFVSVLYMPTMNFVHGAYRGEPRN